MFDKLFEFIINSSRFGFALAFAGTIFLFGNKADWWSITLSPEHASYIIFATLLGYGMLLARVLSSGSLILWNIGEVLWLANKRWRENRNVMSSHTVRLLSPVPPWPAHRRQGSDFRTGADRF
jgi:hypothetical protein